MKTLLITLLFSTSLFAQNELTLIFKPSAKGLDWETPKSLFISYLKNSISFSDYHLGHVFIEKNCGGEKEFIDIHPKHIDVMNQLLLGQKGLGVLYHSFEGEMTINKEGPKLPEAPMNYIQFLLNESHCKRLNQFIAEYKDKNVSRHFGLPHRPLVAEGATSASFAVGLLELLDILDYEMKVNWFRQVNLPHEYSGLPIDEKSIGVFKLLFGNPKWAQDNENHRILAFWDIEKMYSWVNEKMKEPQIYKNSSREKLQGLTIDKSHVPAPVGPMWLIQPKS